MKIKNTCKGVIRTNSTEEVKKFGICESSIAYKILMNNLYTNKIGTIIRELTCNAYDSQVQNGNPNQSFDIHVPSEMEKTFWIQDYGTGLTQKEVDGIYTQFFNSTKNDSNDYIGGLGLGSKTPFCYTDSFFVTSRKDGVETIYKMHKGKDSSPTYSIFAQTKTDKPNGLKVEIDVNQEDISNFIYEIREFFSYTDLRPNFLNAQKMRIPEFDLKYKIDNLSVYRCPDKTDKSIRIRLGKVAYPLYMYKDLRDAEFYGLCAKYCRENPDLSEYSLRNFIYELYYNSSYNNLLIFDFPIGSLEVTASREALSLDEESKKLLINKLFKVAVKIYHQAQKDRQNMKTVQDYVNYQKKYSGISRLGTIEATLEDTVRVSGSYAVVNSEVIKELTKDLTRQVSYSYFGKNRNDRYRRELSIPNAKNVNETGYLYKMYIGSGTVTSVITWLNDKSPVPCAMYLKAHKDDLPELKKRLAQLPKGLFNVEEIYVEKLPIEKKVSIPLYDGIKVDGVKVTSSGVNPDTGEIKYETSCVYELGKSDLEKIKEAPIYYVEKSGREMEDWKMGSLVTALSRKGITEIIFALRPRQILTLQKAGYKLVLAPEALGYNYITKNNFYNHFYNNSHYVLENLPKDIIRYNLFSKELRESLEEFTKRYIKKYKRDYIYYGRDYISNSDMIYNKMLNKYLDTVNTEIINDLKKDPNVIKNLLKSIIDFGFNDYTNFSLLGFLRSNSNKLEKVIKFLKKDLDSFVKL